MLDASALAHTQTLIVRLQIEALEWWRKRHRKESERIKLFESNRHSNDFNPIHRSCCVIRIFITTSTSERAREMPINTRVYVDTAIHIFFFFTAAVAATVARSCCLPLFPILNTQKKRKCSSSSRNDQLRIVATHPKQHNKRRRRRQN